MNVNWLAWWIFIAFAVVSTIVEIRTDEGTVANKVAWYVGTVGLVCATLTLVIGIF